MFGADFLDPGIELVTERAKLLGYDVIVTPRKNQAYSIIAESMGRTAMVRGTLAPKPGMVGPMYKMRPKPLLTMADMAGMMGGMDHSGMSMEGMESGASMEGMDHSNMEMVSQNASNMQMEEMDHSNMDHSNMQAEPMDHSNMQTEPMDHSNMQTAPMDHSNMQMTTPSRNKSSKKSGRPSFYAPGSGLTPTAANGGKFLSYNDLRASKPLYRERKATRTIELRLTGNMERYIWSINGVKLKDAEPLRLKYGERVRFKFVNETMMAHPMHLHGMWSLLDNGSGKWDPIKHVINVNPGTTVYSETEVDVTGQWAFHCHLSYHADAGMFRKVVIEGGPA